MMAVIAKFYGLGVGLREVRRVQPQLLADGTNQIRVELMMRSCQRQLRDPALAMDRQMSMSLAAMVGLRIETASAFRKPLAECVDLHR